MNQRRVSGTPLDKVPLQGRSEQDKPEHELPSDRMLTETAGEHDRHVLEVDARSSDRDDRLRILEQRVNDLPDTGQSLEYKLILREMLRLMA
jgi:hypothetical protein